MTRSGLTVRLIRLELAGALPQALFSRVAYRGAKRSGQITALGKNTRVCEV
jgi:hypothetical protein